MTTDQSRAALLAQNYAVALQQAIEAHCRGEQVPAEVAVRCPHHAKKLDAALSAIEAAQGDSVHLAAADSEGVSGSDVPARPTSPAEERAAFEAWCISEFGEHANLFLQGERNIAWVVWQARAALAGGDQKAAPLHPSPGKDK